MAIIIERKQLLKELISKRWNGKVNESQAAGKVASDGKLNILRATSSWL